MEDSQSTECALLSVGTGKLVPAFAFSYPLNLTFIIAEGGSGSSFSALVSWLSHPTAPGTAQRPVPVVPLAQLLPSDADPALCHTLTPPTALTLPGLSRALVCNDPGLANGEVYAFQMTTFADYEAAWTNYNKWWGFSDSVAETACPPAGTDTSAQGTIPWFDNFFPAREGQVLECEWVGVDANTPAYTWTYPTENAFIVAQGAPGTTFAALNTWWTNNASPVAPPSPAAP